MIRTNIRIGKYSNIFEYPNIRHTMAQMDKISSPQSIAQHAKMVGSVLRVKPVYKNFGESMVCYEKSKKRRKKAEKSEK